MTSVLEKLGERRRPISAGALALISFQKYYRKAGVPPPDAPVAGGEQFIPLPARSRLTPKTRVRVSCIGQRRNGCYLPLRMPSLPRNRGTN